MVKKTRLDSLPSPLLIAARENSVKIGLVRCLQDRTTKRSIVLIIEYIVFDFYPDNEIIGRRS